MTAHRISSEVREEQRAYAPIHSGGIMAQEWLSSLIITSCGRVEQRRTDRTAGKTAGSRLEAVFRDEPT